VAIRVEVEEEEEKAITISAERNKLN